MVEAWVQGASREGKNKYRRPGPGALVGTGNAALFPFTFPGPESGEQHSREAPGREAGSCARRRPGRPGQQEREQRGKKRPALRAERAAERGETSARPPVSGPPPRTQGGRPSAQHWHGRVGGSGLGPRSSRELRNHLRFVVFLLARHPGGRAEAASGRARSRHPGINVE
ncbi:uncharacterized protein LOC118910386 isoform X2 [Manis pentadactyla]|uniref:uncharacterized protein LOC118910386 isoform X2 n=1 Tax=Manis pentadactyla TaxID=143292 RepID=UPI00255D0819|nr:uncharacterized protein LOC118910386 isoform X2 [Manis pentadactyla]